MRSQWFGPALGVCTSVQRPFTLYPRSSNRSFPFAKPSLMSSTATQVPLSHTMEGPAPYSPFRDYPLELGIVEGMRLHVHGQPLVRGVGRWALRDGPRL